MHLSYYQPTIMSFFLKLVFHLTSGACRLLVLLILCSLYLGGTQGSLLLPSPIPIGPHGFTCHLHAHNSDLCL